MSEQNLDIYEDKVRLEKQDGSQNKYSKYSDLIYYESSRTPGLRLAMTVRKPDKPSTIILTTHGWHMSMPEWKPNDDKPDSHVVVLVDMRGRAFSTGSPDCNGLELYDVIDACEYVKKHYAEYISDPEVVYFKGGSGGGGNCYAILNKFPDYFAAAASMCGPSDYMEWYDDDPIGEFQDELEVWVGPRGEKGSFNEAYASRSGLYGLENLYTPLFIAHGNADNRVPVSHMHHYLERAKELEKDHLIGHYELDGVGKGDHWTGASDDQMKKMGEGVDGVIANNTTPINIPRKGRLIVQGYVVTKHFSVFCDSIDNMGEIIYDLDADSFEFKGNCGYKLIKHNA